MIKLLKHIWAGPWTVKASFLFLAFIFLVLLIADPGRVIFTTLFVATVLRLVSWIFDEE